MKKPGLKTCQEELISRVAGNRIQESCVAETTNDLYIVGG